MAFGVFVLRRRPGYQPAYRTWGYPIVPAVFIAASLIIVVNQIVRTPIEAATGLGIVALGVPVYYLVIARRATALTEAAYGQSRMTVRKLAVTETCEGGVAARERLRGWGPASIDECDLRRLLTQFVPSSSSWTPCESSTSTTTTTRPSTSRR